MVAADLVLIYSPETLVKFSLWATILAIFRVMRFTSWYPAPKSSEMRSAATGRLWASCASEPRGSIPKCEPRFPDLNSERLLHRCNPGE